MLGLPAMVHFCVEEYVEVWVWRMRAAGAGAEVELMLSWSSQHRLVGCE